MEQGHNEENANTHEDFFLHIVGLSLVFLVRAQAQDSLASADIPSIPSSWFRLGYGQTQSHIFLGGGLFFSIHSRIAVGLRGGITTEYALIEQPGEFFWDLAPAIAYTPLAGSTGLLSLSAGIGLVGGTRRGQPTGNQLVIEEHERIQFLNACVIPEIQMTLFVSRSLGLGINGFVNLNSERTFWGYHLGVQFRRQ